MLRVSPSAPADIDWSRLRLAATFADVGVTIIRGRQDRG
jgi:hypothetical protein